MSANVTSLRAETNAALTGIATAVAQAELAAATVPLYDAEGGALSTVTLKANNARLLGALHIALAYAQGLSTQVSTLEAPTTVQVVMTSGIDASMTVGLPTVSIASPPTATIVAALNCGGPSYSNPASGAVWSADQSFTGGATADWTGSPTAGVTDTKVFDTERAGVGIAAGSGFQYAIPVPGPGNYVATLMWVEHYAPAAQVGLRLNDVFFGDRATGTKIVSALDVFYCCQTAYAQGGNRALIIERNVTVSGSTLNLDFAPASSSQVATGSLSAIQIRTGADASADPAALNGGTSSGVLPGTRDKTQWPYAQNSPANMPIGSGAVYQAAGLTAPSALNSSAKVYVDTVEVVIASASDPPATVSTPGSFGDRDGGTISINGTLPHFPQSYLVADATGSSQPNEIADIIDADGVTVRRINAMCHTAPGAQVFGFNYGNSDGNGTFSAGPITAQFPHGGHATQLNGMAHALRAADFTGPAIRHALGLELCGPRNYKYSGSVGTSFRWPAVQCDSYAGTAWTATGNGTSPNGTHYSFTYGSLNPSLPSYMQIGALLAIHPSKVYADYAVTTALGKKFFDCLQNYGGYALDDSAGYDYWNSANLTIRADAYSALNAVGGLTQAVRDEIARMIGDLYVITNNSSSTIGGGGTPRQPLAPPFA